MNQVLIRLLAILLKTIQKIFKSKEELVLENLALRHQLSVYQLKKTKPKLTDLDRSFWVALKQTFSKWMDSLIIVKPETVVRWQKQRFKSKR